MPCAQCKCFDCLGRTIVLDSITYKVLYNIAYLYTGNINYSSSIYVKIIHPNENMLFRCETHVSDDQNENLIYENNMSVISSKIDEYSNRFYERHQDNLMLEMDEIDNFLYKNRSILAALYIVSQCFSDVSEISYHNVFCM